MVNGGNGLELCCIHDDIATPNEDGNINTNGSSMIANDFLYIYIYIFFLVFFK